MYNTLTCTTPHKRQSKVQMQSSNVNQKPKEAELSTANCRQSVVCHDCLQRFRLSFDPSVYIVTSG